MQRVNICKAVEEGKEEREEAEGVKDHGNRCNRLSLTKDRCGGWAPEILLWSPLEETIRMASLSAAQP